VKTLVLGIGNPILGDDGVGVRVVEALTHRIGDGDIELRAANTDGLGLLELILGYDRLILVDALMSEGVEAGRIYRLGLEAVASPSPSVSLTHRVNLATAVELGRKLFLEEMPKEIVIFAVGVKEISQITEEMTAEVGSAVPEVCELILKEVATFT
jgi:hydrogenase maturation protease